MPPPHPSSFSLALGTSSLGAESSAGTAEQDAALEVALAMLGRDDCLIDTANMYAGGRSERVLGLALAALPVKDRAAAAARIISKVDRDMITGAFDARRVHLSVEETLTRLGLSALQLLHLHDPYTVTVAEAMSRGGAVDALMRLRDEGVVDRIGIAAGPVPMLRSYIDTGVFDAVLCHNRWTLVDRSAGGIYEAAKARGMTVFNAAPFGGDLLAKGARAGARYGYRPASPELLEWTARAQSTCEESGVSLAAAALHFSLRQATIDHTVVGASTPARLEELIALRDERPPDSLWPALESLGLAPSPIDDTAYGAEE